MKTKFVLLIFKYNDKEILEELTELQQFENFKDLYDLVNVEKFNMDHIKYQGNLLFGDNVYELYSLNATEITVNREFKKLNEWILSNNLLDRASLVTFFMNEYGRVFITEETEDKNKTEDENTDKL